MKNLLTYEYVEALSIHHINSVQYVMHMICTIRLTDNKKTSYIHLKYIHTTKKWIATNDFPD